MQDDRDPPGQAKDRRVGFLPGLSLSLSLSLSPGLYTTRRVARSLGLGGLGKTKRVVAILAVGECVGRRTWRGGQGGGVGHDQRLVVWSRG